MAYRTLDQLADGSIIKTTLSMLKASGVKYMPEFLREEPGFRGLCLIGQYLTKKKADIRFEYVHSHKEYDPLFDTHKEFHYGYALMMYINDVPAVCVKYNQDLPFTGLASLKSYQEMHVIMPKKIYKTLSPGKEIHGFLKEIPNSEQADFFKTIFYLFKQLHDFNKKMKSGNKLLITTGSANYCFTAAAKVLNKKKRLITVRKQQVVLMGDRTKFIINPEWFTDEGVDIKDIQTHTVYLLTD